MTRPRVRGGPTDRDRRQTELDVIVDDVRLASWNDGCVRRGATPRLQSCGNLDDWTVIDRTTLRGLTQFPRGSVSDVAQSVEFKSHRAAVRFKGGFCATLFEAARKSLILNGEMSEWSIEHAWKACVGETLPRVRIPLSPPPNLPPGSGSWGCEIRHR